MLAKTYRFTAYNACGQTIDIAGVVVKGRRWKFDSTGALVHEATEASLMSNAGTIANASYSSSAAIDNSTDLFLGGDFTWTLVAPTSAAGDVTLYCDVSTDGGTTWPTNGRGYYVGSITAASATTYVQPFSL